MICFVTVADALGGDGDFPPLFRFISFFLNDAPYVAVALIDVVGVEQTTSCFGLLLLNIIDLGLVNEDVGEFISPNLTGLFLLSLLIVPFFVPFFVPFVGLLRAASFNDS